MAGATVKMKKRLNIIIAIAVITAFSIVAANLLKITVFQHDFYIDYANSRQVKKETIVANRGSIYDRNMNILAQSATVWDVTISPKDIKTKANGEKAQDVENRKEKIASALTEILGVDKEAVLAKMEKNTQYEIIQKKVEEATAEKVRTFIKENKYANDINLIENTKRYYPSNNLASSVIGFTGTDEGLYGLEQKYNDTLSGTNGSIITLKNARSEAMPTTIEQKNEAIDGNSLRLTIDSTIQSYLEKALSQVMTQHKPKNGCAGIVMNVKTGEILAMANYPNFNLNDPYTITDQSVLEAINALSEDKQADAKYQAQQAQWKNKCISDAYEPGSVFKTVTTAAAVEEKVVAQTDTFYCPGYIQVADRKMNCHRHSGHGTLDFTGALVNSCNPSFVMIGKKLGAEKFFRYFEGFGLTEKTGIDLPGETISQYYTAQQLENEVRLASCSFGQSSSLTPIQMVTAVSAIVNGGNLVTPYVVKDVLDANGNIVKSNTPTVKRQVISEETSKTVATMMEAVVNGNRGSNAAIKGYRIGGKSGSAQKLSSGSTEAKIAYYAGVAPIDDPEIIAYVMVDEPTSGVAAGAVQAAPAVASVLSDTLPYIGISPEYTQEELASLAATVPTVTGLGILEATSRLSMTGFSTPTIIGNGATITKQVPSAGEKLAKDGKVLCYTDNIEPDKATIPNVEGLSPAVAKQKLLASGFNVIVTGSAENIAGAYIQSQSIKAGTAANKGTVVKIASIVNISD